MTKIKPEIRDALADKLGVTKRTVYNRVDKVREEFNHTINKNEAANILASREGIDVGELLGEEELSKIRELEMGTTQTKTVVKKEGNNKSKTTASTSGNLSKRRLDSELYKRCSSHFERGKYQSAVRDSFIVLEERIRDKGGYPPEKYGVDLVSEAFHYQEGSLSFGETESEKRGLMNLYRSAFQTFRNPSNHRFLDDMDGNNAFNIIHFVNQLLVMMEDEYQNG